MLPAVHLFFSLDMLPVTPPPPPPFNVQRAWCRNGVVWMWQLSYAGRLTFVWFLKLVSVTFQCLARPWQGHGFSVRNCTPLVYTTCKLRNQQKSNSTKDFCAKTLVSIKETGLTTDRLILSFFALICSCCNSYKMQKTLTT